MHYKELLNDLQLLETLESKFLLFCDGCEQDVFVRKSRIRTKLKETSGGTFFCSIKCKTKKNSFTTKCANCQKEISRTIARSKKYTKMFCSKSCRSTYVGATYIKPKLRHCAICHTQYQRSHTNGSLKHCELCINKTNTTADIDASVSKIHGLLIKDPSQYFKTLSIKDYMLFSKMDRSDIKYKIHALSRNWNKNLKKLPCQICGYSFYTELCHIKPIQSFVEYATLGDVNSPDNIAVLCPNHHKELDKGLLTPNQIPKRNEP